MTAEYEKVIGSLRDTVEALRRKLDKVTQLANRLGKFVSRMGLTKEWEESERPKTMKEKLQKHKKDIRNGKGYIESARERRNDTISLP